MSCWSFVGDLNLGALRLEVGGWAPNEIQWLGSPPFLWHGVKGHLEGVVFNPRSWGLDNHGSY